MPLYTFVLGFNGGTYIRQVRARSYKSAPAAWARALQPGEIQGIGASSLGKLKSKIEEDYPVPLDGPRNVWCIGALVRGKLALAHFIQTAEGAGVLVDLELMAPETSLFSLALPESEALSDHAGGSVALLDEAAEVLSWLDR
jgi:hypothetical protein